jgi:hypothetical protein
VKKFADYYFYDNMYTGGAYVDCLPLLYWTSAIKFIDQYVFEKSPRME